MGTTTEAPASSRTPTPDRSSWVGSSPVAPLLGLVLGVLLVGAVHTWVSLDAVAPVQTKDEIGYLAGARLLATGEGAGLLTPEHAGGYAVGWGLLTAPLWWLTSHPPTVYAASVAVNVALAALLVLPATAVARRLGLGPGPAVLVAVALGLAGGRLGYTGYALPEALLAVQLTTLLWLLLRLWDPAAPSRDGPRDRVPPPGVLTPVAVGLLAAWLVTTHARFAPVAALTLVALGGWAWRRRSVAGAVAAALGTAGAAAGWWLNSRVEAVLYGDVARVDVAAEQVDGLVLGDALALAVGHAWYGAVAWFGLSLAGWWVAVARTAGLLRGPDRGAGAWVPWAWLAVGTLLQLGVGAAYLSSRLGDGGRTDQLVYGRYGDPVWFLLALVGAAALLARARPTRLLVASLAGLVVVSGAALVVLRLLEDRVAGFVQLNVPGIEAWAWRDAEGFTVPWLPATVLAVLVLGGLAVAVHRGRPAGPLRLGALACVGVVLLSSALVAERRNIEPRDAWIRSLFAVDEVVGREPDAPVLLVVDRPLLLSGNALQWWLADRDPVVVEPGPLPAGTAVGTLVVAPTQLPPAPPTALVGTDPTGTYGVWRVSG